MEVNETAFTNALEAELKHCRTNAAYEAIVHVMMAWRIATGQSASVETLKTREAGE
jgi:hypothetical protein